VFIYFLYESTILAYISGTQGQLPFRLKTGVVYGRQSRRERIFSVVVVEQ
jgi:hypothetical protein